MTHPEKPQSWSDLPTELAGLVLCRLPAYSDCVRFGAVCRHWSFSAKQLCLPPPVPCLAFPDGTFFSLPHSESFQFPDSVGYHSSSGEWLVFLCDGTYSLKNPFSKVTLTLPKLSCLCPIEEPEEIIPVALEEEIPQESLDMDAEMSVYKLVVCSSLLAAAIVNLGPLYTVALCRPGADSWLVSRLLRRNQHIDMMFCGGKLYVLDEFKNLLAIDVGEDNDNSELSISQVECLIDNPSVTFSLMQNGATSIHQYLVESHDALLMVRTTFFGVISDDDTGCMSTKPVGIEFKVFEADFHSSRWVDVTSLGDDQALYISQSYSQSVCVSPYKLKGNSIFILDDGTCNWFWSGKTSSYAVHRMSDGGTYLPMPQGSFKGGKAPATWLFPSSLM
ncbi:unnamed protein product [Urochloa humidicola]